MEYAKVFQNGQSQAVRLPKSYRFSCDEVCIKKVGEIIMLFNPVHALESFRAGETLTDDVYESILEARREEAEYEAANRESLA
jgi:antitoxin VapB